MMDTDQTALTKLLKELPDLGLPFLHLCKKACLWGKGLIVASWSLLIVKYRNKSVKVCLNKHQHKKPSHSCSLVRVLFVFFVTLFQSSLLNIMNISKKKKNPFTFVQFCQSLHLGDTDCIQNFHLRRYILELKHCKPHKATRHPT